MLEYQRLRIDRRQCGGRPNQAQPSEQPWPAPPLCIVVAAHCSTMHEVGPEFVDQRQVARTALAV
jgi:hypothetical protein